MPVLLQRMRSELQSVQNMPPRKNVSSYFHTANFHAINALMSKYFEITLSIFQPQKTSQ